jgi:hypothetical protein
MSDNEHTPPPLRDSAGEAAHSDVLSVKNPVGEPIPEFCQHPEEGAKIPSSVRRQDSGDIFPNKPARLVPLSHSAKCEHEVAAWVSQSFSKARDTERLAGGSADKNVNCMIRPILEFCHVAMVRNIGVVVRQHGRRKALYFAEECRLPSHRMPSLRCRLDTAAQ